MCARYAFFTIDNIMWEYMMIDKPDLDAQYNFAPTDAVPAVINGEKGRELQLFQWGLVPSWAKEPSIGAKMINARGETLREKPSFRAPFKRRRCLIPADGFYEWQGEKGHKQPYFIRMKSAQPFAFAGLWEYWEGVEGALMTCTIITTSPNELLQTVHNRMPVIIAREDYNVWMNPAIQDTKQLVPLLAPFPSNQMEMFPVTKAVSNPRFDSPTAIIPVEPETLF